MKTIQEAFRELRRDTRRASYRTVVGPESARELAMAVLREAELYCDERWKLVPLYQEIEVLGR